MNHKDSGGRPLPVPVFSWKLGQRIARHLAGGLGGALLIALVLFPAATVKGQGKQAVAIINGRSISEATLAKAAKAQLLPLENQEYEIKHDALEKLIGQKLLEQAAKKKGITAEALLQQEVDRKVAEPSDAEVLAYYLAQKSHITQPFAQVRTLLRLKLREAELQRARQAYMDRLREQAHVVVLLSPPRVKVSYDPKRLIGNPNAPILIVEFADFQCPFCRKEESVVTKLLAKYGNKVALAYRDFPITEAHPFAEQAAEASRCAGAQGKFWKFHDMLFAGKLDRQSLEQDARGLKLNVKQFDRCLASGKYRAAIEKDRLAAEGAGVVGTPTFFINGISVAGARSERSLSRVIDEELARQRLAHDRQSTSSRHQPGSADQGNN